MYGLIWRGEIENSHHVEIREVDGYLGVTFTKMIILDQDNNVCFDSPVYVNYKIYCDQKVVEEESELWKKAARDILDGDDTGIWRCCRPDMTPWNPDGSPKY